MKSTLLLLISTLLITAVVHSQTEPDLSLLYALMQDNVSAVNSALEGGSSANAVFSGGYTAVMIAALNNQAGTVRGLLEAGADPSLETASGLTINQLTADPEILRILSEVPALSASAETADEAKLPNIAVVQQRLNELGYDPGEIDGVWGSKTTNALLDYQKDAGLATTGQVDKETWEAMRPDKPSVKQKAGKPGHLHVVQPGEQYSYQLEYARDTILCLISPGNSKCTMLWQYASRSPASIQQRTSELSLSGWKIETVKRPDREASSSKAIPGFPSLQDYENVSLFLTNEGPDSLFFSFRQ